MTPEVDQILNISGGQLMGVLAPALPPGYPQSTAGLLSFMLMLSAQEYDRAADIRARENSDMRALFAELAPRVTDAALAAKLKTASAGKDESLTITALNARNAELRKLLIVLHWSVEADAAANASVWRVLTAMANGRVLKLPGA